MNPTLYHLFPLTYAPERPKPADWADVLATLPLFAGVARRRLRKLARSAALAEFARGETVLLPGDRDDALYVILGGEARATSARRILRAGDTFAASRVVATTDLHVMLLPSKPVLELVRPHRPFESVNGRVRRPALPPRSEASTSSR
jgi:signal-transduction protein with cAMP-binding, CBS, and nucleotidyltransferase domain